jgi:hypothetical protein
MNDTIAYRMLAAIADRMPPDTPKSAPEAAITKTNRKENWESPAPVTQTREKTANKSKVEWKVNCACLSTLNLARSIPTRMERRETESITENGDGLVNGIS